MSENSSQLKDDENVEAENQFLKMKLMLEQGAQLGSMQTDGNLPLEIENQFLRNIIEFERQFEAHKTIKVFDKIERPVHFKPVADIPDNEIEKAWDVLFEYLQKYGIELSVCSPNVSNRELYRFTTEELFDHEMDDMDLPGMMSCFIYDEFHPDHKYDNTRKAVDDCIKPMLEKDPMRWMHHFRKVGLTLNAHFPLTADEFQDRVNNFKKAYEDIEMSEIDVHSCSIEDKTCRVNGYYTAIAKLHSSGFCLRGKWMVEFELDDDPGYWYIVNVQVEGINF